MPSLPPRLCGRCRAKVQGQCPTCDGWRATQSKNWKNGSTRRWRRTREIKLANDPVCEWPGCFELATEVDHIDGTDYDTQRHDQGQLRSLCRPHHATRTAAQSNAAKG